MVGAYLVGDASASTAVVLCADAPGWRAPGVRQFAELLNKESGALVVVPDLARGDTWYGDADPAARARDANFADWQKGHPPSRVARDIAAIGAALRERGAKRVCVVGVGTGAVPVAELLGRTEKEKSEEPSMDAGVLACAIGLGASAASDAAASGIPTLFVWGGGDTAAARAQAVVTEVETRKTQNKWKSVVAAGASEFFVFANEKAEGGDGDRRAETAKAVSAWFGMTNDR